jgi:mitochondrial fission protein ELM1
MRSQTESTDNPAGDPPYVWLLMEQRTGDNNQLLALAAALGWPFEAKQMKYNQFRRIRPMRRGLATVAAPSRRIIQPPWPDLVICIGYTSVPVARYIRRQTNGRTKLVHIGNPRARLDDFDLQITTPQYSRTSQSNLVELPFPIGNPARTVVPTPDEIAWLAAYPEPRRLVAVGGPARYWQLDHTALRDAVERIRRKSQCGSMLIVTSGRTRATTTAFLQRLTEGLHETVLGDFPRFGTLLRQADEIYVTADSVSMISEAVLSGKPVGIIPIKRSIVGRITEWFYERPLKKAALPNFPRYWAMLKRENLAGTVDCPLAAEARDTVEGAVEQVQSLFSRPTSFNRHELNR